MQPPSAPAAPTALKLDYAGQLNLLNTRLISPVEVSGSGNVVFTYDIPGNINFLGQDTKISSVTPSITITSGQVTLTKEAGAASGGTAFSGLEFTAPASVAPGSFVNQGGQLVIDLGSLVYDKVAQNVESGTNYNGNTGTLNAFSTLNLGAPNQISFLDSNGDLNLLGTADIGGVNKLIYPVALAAGSSPQITLPAPFRFTRNLVLGESTKVFTYEAKFVYDQANSKVRLEITLVSVADQTTTPGQSTTTSADILTNNRNTIIAIKSRPVLAPLLNEQKNASLVAFNTWYKERPAAGTATVTTIESYTRDTLPPGTIICEFNQAQRSIQGRFGIKGRMLGVAPDHSGQLSRLLAESSMVRDGALAPLRVLNKNWNFWVAPQGSHGTSKAAIGAPKSRQRSAGANFGFAYKIAQQLSAVISGAFNQAHSKVKGNASKSRTNVFSGMAMVRYTPSFFYVDGGLLLAPTRTHDQRKHPTKGKSRIRTNARGHMHGFIGGIGATVPLFELFFQPRFDYTWTRSMTHGTKDKNGGAFRNRTARMSSAQRQMNLGMDVAKPFMLDNGMLGVQVGAYWAHYKQVKNPRIRVYSKLMRDTMGNSGWSSEVSKSRKMNNLRVNAGTQFIHQSGVSLGAQYTYERGHYMRQHSGTLRVGYAF